jgi:hypothetical protein
VWTKGFLPADGRDPRLENRSLPWIETSSKMPAGS